MLARISSFSVLFFLFLFSVFCSSDVLSQSNFSESLINENDVLEVVEYNSDTLLIFTNTGYYIIPNKFEIDSSLFDVSLKIETNFITTVRRQNDSTIWLAGRSKLYKMEKLHIEEFSFPSLYSIYDLDFDSHDNMYIGTWGDGLYKFNGTDWKQYTILSDNLTDDRVTSVLVDDDDTVWLGYHMHGIGYMDSEGIHNFEEDSYFHRPFDVAEMRIHNSKLFICSWDGLYVFDNNQLTMVYESDPIESINFDSNDTAWLATYDNGLLKIHVNDIPYGGEWDLDESNYIGINNTVISQFPEVITIDPHGKLWVASFNGINYFNGKWHLVSQETLYDNRIQKLKFYDNYTWVCTYRGLSVLHNQKWKSFYNPAIKNQMVNDILILNDSSIWVCTRDSILKFKFDAEFLTLDLIESYKLSLSNTCLAERNDTIYVGTWGRGILRYFDNTWDTLDTDEGLNNLSIKDILINDTVIWATTLSGITRINQKGEVANYLKSTDIPVKYSYEIAIDTNKDVWFSCTSGLLKYENESFNHYYSGSQYDTYRHIAIDPANNIWTSDVTNAYLFKDNVNEHIRIDDDWYSSNVLAMAVDSIGNVWFGTGYGINTVLIEKINPPADFDLSYFQPEGCFDRIEVTASSSGYSESFEIRVVDQSNAQTEKVDSNVFNISNISNDTVSIQIKGSNAYFPGSWSDTIIVVLDTTTLYYAKVETICEGDSVLLANKYQNEPGVYTDTLQNYHGCDSILVTELTVIPKINSHQVSICRGDSAFIGNRYYREPAIHFDTLQNYLGCDSISKTALTIKESTYSLITATASSSYTSPSGRYVWLNSGVYSDTVINAVGCDSIITINLTMTEHCRSEITEIGCNSYTSPSGRYTWTKSGTYADTVFNTSRCDDIYTVNLTIRKIDTSVTVGNTTLTSNEADASFYQWYECDNPEALNDNQREFTPDLIGAYAVYIEKDGCFSISSCYTPLYLSNVSATFENIVAIYPNPTNGQFTIDLENKVAVVFVRVLSLSGQEVYSEEFMDKNQLFIDFDAEDGIYFLQLISETGIKQSYKLIKH